MADQNRYRRHLQKWNYSITPIQTAVRYLEGDGYTREQMTEMCGIDIISLFNSAYDIVTLDGKRYRKITSCALLKNIQSVNLPNSSHYLGGNGCYLIFEDGVQVAKLGSGSSYTFSSTTTSKAIIYYSLKSSNNYCSGVYSNYGHLGYQRFINPVWTFEPFAKLDIQGRSHYNDSNLKQIHLQEFPVEYSMELRECGSAYGTLRFSGAINFNSPNIYSSVHSIKEIIIEKEVISCNTITMSNDSNFNSIGNDNRLKLLVLMSSMKFIMSSMQIMKKSLDIQISENALNSYSLNNGVLLYNNSEIVSGSKYMNNEELVFGNGITSIQNYAFCICSIKSIDLSNTQITILGSGSLAVGDSLTELKLPNNLTTLNSSYYPVLNSSIYAPNLEKLIIPSSCTLIKAQGIRLDLTIGHIIDLPKDVVLEGRGVYNTLLKELYLRWDTIDKIQTWGVGNWDIFSSCRTNGTCILHIPQGMTQDYIDKGYIIGSTYNTFGQIIDDL